MATINIPNIAKAVAVGLEWHALPGTTSERKEIDAIAKQAQGRIGCTVSDEETGVTVLGLAHERAPGAVCGAAWLARASNREALVLVEPLDDGKVWLCAVRAGLPVQGCDLVIDVQRLHEMLPEVLADSPDARICSTLESLDTSYPGVAAQAFAELVANTKPERLRRVHGISPSTVLAVVGAVIGVAAYWGGGSYLETMHREEAQSKLAQIAQQQQAQDAQRQRQLALQHQQAGIEVLKEAVLGRPLVTTYLAALFAAVEHLPMFTAGWSLDGFTCTAQACTAVWSRGKFGTLVTFVADAERRGWTMVNASGDQAVTSHPITAEARDASVDALEAPVPFGIALESKLQQAKDAGLRYEMGKLQMVEQMLPQDTQAGQKQGPGQAASAGPKPLDWKIGSAVVKGGLLYELRAMADYIEHAAVAVDQVRADITNKQWTLELKYATR